VNYIFSGTIQENAKRMNSIRLQKTPELNRSGPQENMHLEGTRGPHAKAEPGLAQPRPIGPVGRPIGPPGPDQAQLPEGSSTAS
jgi:hypothetical protein